MIMRDMICMGGSAGGLEAIRGIIGRWDRPIPAVVFVVIHTPSDVVSALPAIMAKTDTIPADSEDKIAQASS